MAGKSNDLRGKSEGSRKTQFKAGNKLGERGKNRTKINHPKLLRDMRFVYDNPKEKDATEGHRNCRALLERDSDKFLARMAALERNCLQARAKLNSPTDGPKENGYDQGTENALALCGRWLKDREAQQALEDAEFAKRPDVVQLGATLQEKLTAALDREKRLRRRVEELEQKNNSL